jgi:hypothetical protein
MYKKARGINFLVVLIYACTGWAELVYDQNFDATNTWWSPVITGGSVATYITNGVEGTTTHSGTGALSISNSAVGTDSWWLETAGAVVSYSPAIIPEQEYELSVWVKTENIVAADTKVYTKIGWRTSDGTFIPPQSAASTVIKTNQGWTQLTLTATSPVNAGGASIHLYAQGLTATSAATVTFDDVQLEAVVPETYTPGVVYDQDFDDNNTWWTPDVTGGTVAIYITNGIASNTTHSGTGALSISSSAVSAENWYLHKDGAVVSYSPSIFPEKQYELSVWVKMENVVDSDTRVYTKIGWRTSDGTYITGSDISTKLTADQDWTRLTLTATSPLNAAGASLYLYAQGYETTAAATVIFDDVQLTALAEDIDGIPVSWILDYWTNSGDYVAEDDDDADGVSNGDEYWANTIPTDAGSVLKLLGTQVSGTDVTVVYQNGGTNADVYVDYRNDLTSGGWTPIATNAAPAIVTNNYLHAGIADTEVFYRLRAQRND